MSSFHADKGGVEANQRRLIGSRVMCAIAVFLAALPVVIFYSILFADSTGLPDLDDYEAVLGFVNHWYSLPGIHAKISYFLSAQHNEYKLYLEHASVLAQVALGHQVNFKLLSAIGNGFVFLLAFLLWKMFMPKCRDITLRLLLFVPVAWLVFQLQYVETLDWTTSLQNVSVVFFCLGAICLLTSENATRVDNFGAVSCLALAVASSGNGLLLIPIGLMILVPRRRYTMSMLWVVASIGCLAAYLYRYNFLSSQNAIHQSIFATLRHTSPLYGCAFLGNALAYPLIEFDFSKYLIFEILARLCALLGLIVAVFFYAVWRRGYFRRNRQVFYCVLFLFLTALGVTGMRSGYGPWEALSSRYGIYSALLLVFVWFAIVDEFILPKKENAGMHSLVCPLSAVFFVVISFSIVMDIGGHLYLKERNRRLIEGMAWFERTAQAGRVVGPLLPVPNQPQRLNELDAHAPGVLKKSMKMNLYHPPKL